MNKIIVSAIFAIVMFGSTALANPSACPVNAQKMGKPCAMMNCGAMPFDMAGFASVPANKKEKVSAIIHEYAPKLAEIKDKICVKHWELKALSHCSQTSEKTIIDVARELEVLMDTRRNLMFERLNKLEEVLGKDFFMERAHHGAMKHHKDKAHKKAPVASDTKKSADSNK